MLLAVSHSPSRNPESRISKKWRDDLEMNKAGILKELEDGEEAIWSHSFLCDAQTTVVHLIVSLRKHVPVLTL